MKNKDIWKKTYPLESENWPFLGDDTVKVVVSSPIPYKKGYVIVLHPSQSTIKVLKVYDWNIFKRFLKWTGIKKTWFIGIKGEII